MPLFNGDENDNTLEGTSESDELYGNGGNDILYGYAGDDFLYGGDGDDEIHGGDGFDFLVGGLGNDWIDGGESIDTLVFSGLPGGVIVDVVAGTATGQGSDLFTSIERFWLSSYDDIFLGSDMSEYVLLSRGGDDVVSGAGGNDLVDVYLEPGELIVSIDVDGGAGEDGFNLSTAYPESRENGVTIDLGRTDWQVSGTFAVRLVNVEHLGGTYADDVLRGNDADNFIGGGPGSDIIIGGAGDDYLMGEGALSDGYFIPFDDAITEYGLVSILGTGDDRISGGEGNDTINGGNGDDILRGGPGNDTIYGGQGSNFLAGNGGADVLYGGVDTATIYGGGGPDTIYGSEVADVLRGQGGGDKMWGYGGDDSMTGASGSDEMYGYDGDDTISGGGAADYIEGNAGNDVIDGGGGSDKIRGGTGDDTITLGKGADRVLIEPDSGDDIILDFTEVDSIYFWPAMGITYEDLVIEVVDGVATITWGTEDSITVHGPDAANLTADDFDTGYLVPYEVAREPMADPIESGRWTFEGKFGDAMDVAMIDAAMVA